MGFPLTQDAELDFDTYFALASEQRLAILLDVLSPGITREGQEDFATIRNRITQKHHEIIQLRKKNESIPEPTLMQELFVALSSGVKAMQAISEAQKAKIEAQQKERAALGRQEPGAQASGLQELAQPEGAQSDSDGMNALDVEHAPDTADKSKRKSHKHRHHKPRCIIC